MIELIPVVIDLLLFLFDVQSKYSKEPYLNYSHNKKEKGFKMILNELKMRKKYQVPCSLINCMIVASDSGLLDAGPFKYVNRLFEILKSGFDGTSVSFTDI